MGSARSEEQFTDEYDPAKPNEYESIRKDKERVREEAQQEADRQEELRLLQVRCQSICLGCGSKTQKLFLDSISQAGLGICPTQT